MIDINTILAGHVVSDSRKESLQRAIDLGADDATLVAIRDAARVARKHTIILPGHRFENLSRGRGWARNGQGDSAQWGERVDGGYRVGPGRWSVGAIAIEGTRLHDRVAELELAHGDRCADLQASGQRIAELEAALRRWRCDGIQHTHGDGGNMCLKCRDTDLHPIAAEALKEKT